ncbi:MAG TPA: hypothetical protein VF708_19750 [Pyrinomonadaceae bacterium]|jgi:hypothetical protein
MIPGEHNSSGGGGQSIAKLGDSTVASNVVQAVLILNKQLSDAHRVGLKVDLDLNQAFNSRAPYVGARVYREETLAESPPQKEKK